MRARSSGASVSLADVGGSGAGRAGPGPATVCHAACAWASGPRVASSQPGPPHPGDCVRPRGEPHSGGWAHRGRRWGERARRGPLRQPGRRRARGSGTPRPRQCQQSTSSGIKTLPRPTCPGPGLRSCSSSQRLLGACCWSYPHRFPAPRPPGLSLGLCCRAMGTVPRPCLLPEPW